MRRTVTALLAITASLALASCSNSDGTPPAKATATVTATKAPELTAAEKRKACVDAWADVIDSRPDNFDPEVDEDEEPTECKGLPADDAMDRYWDGLTQRNKENQDKARKCLDDPTCTSLPLP
ncbi:hypothetical protein [Streptomyces sp. NPDC056242]|uniref:hypothetical protein n=1 Tax=Streptomyces sp. NPDC056242 TaxID=3345760 RepID=UPI0035E34630